MEREIKKIQEGEIVCPYCDYEYSESWEYGMEYDGDSTELECPECNKKFSVVMNIETTFTSQGLCEENKDKHKWKEFNHISSQGGKRCKGKRCLICDKYEFDREVEQK